MSERPTVRQLEAFAAMLRCRSAKEAARELGVAPSTIRSHVRDLYGKLDVQCQSQAAIALGWLVVPPTPFWE